MAQYSSPPEPDADGYIETVAAAAVHPRQMTPFDIGSETIILTRIDDKIYAFNSTCPHAGAYLADGEILSRGRVECPLHNYVFDIRSGRVTWPEDEFYRLRCYSVRERDGMVYVKIK